MLKKASHTEMLDSTRGHTCIANTKKNCDIAIPQQLVFLPAASPIVFRFETVNTLISSFPCSALLVSLWK